MSICPSETFFWKTLFFSSSIKAKCLINLKDSSNQLSFSAIRLYSCHRLTHGRLAFSDISPLFVDRFERSLQFCYLEFDAEAISDCFMANSRIFRGNLKF